MPNTLTELYDIDAINDPLLAEYQSARELLQGPDWRQGLLELEALAHRGSIMSMLLVSDAMRDGWMYDQDLPGAEAWYRVAVESGSTRGVFGLGLTHLLMKRFSEAIEELELAASRTYPPAYNALASIYFNGEGVAVDRKRALKLWRKGAALGHLPAKRNLTWMMIHGRYGFWARIRGILRILPVALEIGRVKASNPYTDRMR